MSTRKPPCPTCLACGLETRKHRWCSNGPLPPHGFQCDCETCDADRAHDVLEAARDLVDTRGGSGTVAVGRAWEHLQDALVAYDAAPEACVAYWRANATKIAVARLEVAA